MRAIGAEPVKVRTYSSLLGGVSDKHALAFTEPMVGLLAQEVDHPIEHGLVKGASQSDLFQFGGDLDRGRYHLGTIWGLEYGWLREKYPRLEPLVVCTYRGAAVYSQLMVRKELAQKKMPITLTSLKGMRLAVFDRSSLMDRVFLESRLREVGADPDTFFQKVGPSTNALDAIFAVTKGKADCVVISMDIYTRHLATRPKLELDVVERSPAMPEVVIVGRRDLVDSLRSRGGLWDALRRDLAIVHRTPQGRQCVDFWRMENFAAPEDRDFDTVLTQRLKDYPISVLQDNPNGRQ
jgi:ABC-type phosphate/phosphonate transport system substrate-binding protein